MKCEMLDIMLWMDKLKSEMKEAIFRMCLLFLCRLGIEFKHNFDFSVTTPLPPLDWCALIKYAKDILGKICILLLWLYHNAVPCFCLLPMVYLNTFCMCPKNRVEFMILCHVFFT